MLPRTPNIRIYILLLSLFLGVVRATLAFNNAPSSMESGKSYTVTWTATGSGVSLLRHRQSSVLTQYSKPVTIQLQQGSNGNLLPVADLTSETLLPQYCRNMHSRQLPI